MRIRLTLALAAATAVTGGVVPAFVGIGHTTTLAASQTSSAPQASSAPQPGQVINGHVYTGPNPGMLPGWSTTEAPLNNGQLGRDTNPVCRHVHDEKPTDQPHGFPCNLDPTAPLLPPDPNNPDAP